jgi:membrane dipeptidase
VGKLKVTVFVIVLLLALGLIILHTIVPGMIERGINTIEPHSAYQIRPEAQALHDELFIADLHTDSLLWKRDFLARSRTGHVDLPRLREGNVALQIFSATTKSPADQNYEENTADSDNITLLAVAQLWPIRTWGSIYQRASYQLEKLHRLADASHGQLMLIQNANDLQALVDAHSQGTPVVGGVYLIEGAHPLEGNLDNLNRLFDAGLRIAGLTHFFDNRLGGSLHGISRAGLTPFGESVVRRANELGIIIDIAHASPQMVSDVLELSSRPVILSHGGVKGLCDQGRNLDDDLMRRVAAKGGLIGIGYWAGAVCDISPAGVARSIRYAIDLLGLEHVALGSDYDGATAVLFDTSELAALTQAMLDADFSETEIRAVMGGNALRFFLENLPAG